MALTSADLARLGPQAQKQARRATSRERRQAESVRFFVDGRPVPKGRPRVTRHGTYTPKSTREYEAAIRAARAETEKIKGAKKMNAKDTAERIRGLRTSAGMSQASFAAMCGIEQGQLCNYEMARIMPTIPLCERICRAVGINLLDFLREDDEGKSGIPTEERIGEKVKALRLMRGMNQTELAEKSGVADSTISSIERGERYGIVTTYLYLAEALDVSIAALLGGE